MAVEINTFPDELFLQIFKHIPSRDIRNGIRLVCRRWNRLADDPIFTRNELIVVNCQYQNQCCWLRKRALKRNLSYFELSRRNRPILNLLFRNQQCHQQRKLVHQFWKPCGDRVQSLIFEGCELTYVDIKTIIFWCPFAKHISLLWNNASDSNDWIASVPRRSMPIKIQSITSFSIQLYSSSDPELSYRTVHKILSTLPNLEELKIVVDGKYNYCEDISQEHPPGISSLTAIARYIRTQKRKMKKLWLVQANILPHKEELVDFSSVLSELENLEELTVTGHQFLCLNMRSSTALWKSLPKLTFLSLSKIPESYICENVLLTEILDAVPNLQVLHFESDRSKFFSPFFDEYLIEKILASRLKSLHLIHYDGFNARWMGNDDFRLSPNRSLEELVIVYKSRIVDHKRHCRLRNLFLQGCKNLRHLAISHPHDEVLQTILKYHKSLKSLMLLRAEICSDLGFIGKKSVSRKYPKKTNCISELEDLEQLIVKSMNPDRVTYRISSFFALPKLKSLEMDFVNDHSIRPHKPRFMEDLIRAVSKNTLLEALQFRVRMASDLPQHLLEQLLVSLKELRFFSLTYELENDSRQQDPILHKVQALFAVCPSLRFIVYGKKIFLLHRRSTNEFEVKEVSPSCMKFDKPREMLPSWYSLFKTQPEMWSNLDLIEFD